MRPASLMFCTTALLVGLLWSQSRDLQQSNKQLPEQASPASTNARSMPELVLQTGHTELVTAIAFSPDGRLLAAGGRDNTVRLWEVSTGRLVRVMPALSGYRALAFSPDGAAVASPRGVWEVATGKLRTLTTLTNLGEAIAFSPDGRWLAALGLSHSPGGFQPRIGLVEVATGQEILNLAAGEVATGQELLNLAAGPVKARRSIAFSPDGRRLASTSMDNTVTLWEVPSGKGRVLGGHALGVAGLAFSPDGRWLASGSAGEAEVKIWNVETGERAITLAGLKGGHVVALAFAPDGRHLLTASEVLRFIPSKRVVWRQEGSVSWRVEGPAAEPSAEIVINVWDVASGRELRSAAARSHRSVRAATFSPDGRLLASLDSAGIAGWRIEAGADERLLQVAALRKFRLWDVASGRELPSFGGPVAAVGSVAIAPNQRWLASSCRDGPIKLWDLAAGTEVRRLAHVSVEAMIFSPDSLQLASANGRAMVKVWDVMSGKQLRTFACKGRMTPTFSPDGRLLACAASFHNPYVIELWDVVSGRHVRDFIGRGGTLGTLALSRDGRRLLASADLEAGTVHLWDTTTGLGLGTLKTGQVRAMALSPDGRVLASTRSVHRPMGGRFFGSADAPADAGQQSRPRISSFGRWKPGGRWPLCMVIGVRRTTKWTPRLAIIDPMRRGPSSSVLTAGGWLR